jgi:hypothetical protein
VRHALPDVKVENDGDNDSDGVKLTVVHAVGRSERE